MKNGYFVYDGKQYPTGTVIVVKPFYSSSNKTRYASFIYYDAENNEYSYRFRDTGQRWIVPADIFYNNLIEVTDIFDSSVIIPKQKQLKDAQINGLFIGWVWYIFVIAISIIFYDRVVLWIIASLIFFNWRRKKIKKEGYYVEW